MVIATSPIESQGVYALATNLSSLVGVRLRLFVVPSPTLCFTAHTEISTDGRGTAGDCYVAHLISGGLCTSDSPLFTRRCPVCPSLPLCADHGT